MKSRRYAISFTSLLAVALLATGLMPSKEARADEKPQFAQGRYLIVEGQPRLILGCYEMPKDDVTLKSLVDSGFNLVCTRNRADLDRAEKHGIYGWVPIGTGYGPDKPEQQKQLAKKIRGLKDHPALLAWELPDEILWNVWQRHTDWVSGQEATAMRDHIKSNESASPEQKAKWSALVSRAVNFTSRGLFEKSEAIYNQLRKELGVKDAHPESKFSQCHQRSQKLAAAVADDCRMIREIDPTHLIWQNHAPRNGLPDLRLFNQPVDAVGCDIYPVIVGEIGHSDLRELTLACVGDFTDRMQAGGPGKSVWMVLQGFGWRDIHPPLREKPDPKAGRRPGMRETRFMAYDAIVHGSGAVLYYGTSHIEKDSSLWKDIMAVTQELRALEPGIVGSLPEREPCSTAKPCRNSIDPSDGPRLMLRKAGDDWVLIAVNERAAAVPFSVSDLPKDLEGKTLYRLECDETHVVKNGRFDDGIRAFDVQVYSTSRRFKP
jgi:hypothetical protein